MQGTSSTRPRRRRIPTFVAVFLAVFLAPVASGCGDSDRLKTYPVSGLVTSVDGRPFEGGADSFIVFESVEHGLTATGAIDAEGAFTLGTYAPGDGAVSGRHRISVSPPTPGGDPDQPRSRPTLNPKFRDLDASGLTATVEPQRNNEITVALTE